MATIEKRINADNFITWRVRVRRRGRPPVQKTFINHADAERWGRLIEGEMDRGIFVDRSEAERTTLASALDRYGREVSSHKRGWKAELCMIERLKRTGLAVYSLAALGSKEIAAYRDERSEQVAPATVRLELALLSHLFTIARKEWGMTNLVNPVSGVSLPKRPPGRTQRVTPDQEAALLRAAAGYREMPAIITVAIETAMRRAEIMGLAWGDVDLKKRVAHLPETKNGSPRDVPLSLRAVDILRGLPRQIDGRVFSLSAGFVSLAFSRIAEVAGMPDVRFHDLRHEATSRMAPRFEMHELMKITGHKDARMVLRYYHPDVSKLAQRLG